MRRRWNAGLGMRNDELRERKGLMKSDENMVSLWVGMEVSQCIGQWRSDWWPNDLGVALSRIGGGDVARLAGCRACLVVQVWLPVRQWISLPELGFSWLSVLSCGPSLTPCVARDFYPVFVQLLSAITCMNICAHGYPSIGSHTIFGHMKIQHTQSLHLRIECGFPGGRRKGNGHVQFVSWKTGVLLLPLLNAFLLHWIPVWYMCEAQSTMHATLQKYTT